MNPTRRLVLKAALGLPLVALLPGSLWGAFAFADSAGEGSDAQSGDLLALAIHSDGGPHRLEVEVAQTAAQRQRGLMEREHLPEQRGMLFRFEQEQPAGNAFWMYRTLIPLDIAFIDQDGRIVAINTMPPCESSAPGECPTYPAGAAYYAALEVNGGYFAARNIQVGDCVSVPGEAGFCQPAK
ncbi:hypothetical protein B0H98_101746 [Vreelandella songnenensis]|uniref:DUF192 domain-containing protein n=1 Tax=Vreelandella songnenensis TaxID=1176243 RepID=A0A2T0V9E0_9GAMM|nr:DUF192 domain-containing protein [Halomonas songnenensis]PRY66751.1 hypothetical protein B0H98_101746 [Halomonas songnenensis]